MQHIPLYKVNDILEVLVDHPWSAGFLKGSMIRVSDITSVSINKAHYRAHIVDKQRSWSINDSREDIFLRKISGENDIEYYIKR